MLTAQEAPAARPFLLRSIYVRRSESRLAEHFDPLKGGQRMKSALEGRATAFRVNDYGGQDGFGRTVTFLIHVSFAYLDEDVDVTAPAETIGEEHKLAVIVTEIAADYAIVEGAEPSLEDMQAWGEGAVFVHAWPYWREHCHTTLLRMALPATVVPFLDSLTFSRRFKVEPPVPPVVLEKSPAKVPRKKPSKSSEKTPLR